MKTTMGVFTWMCLVGYVMCAGLALPTVLGNELVVTEEEDPGLVDWIQGEETPLRHHFWGADAAAAEEADELDDKRQYPGGKRQYPGGKRQYPGGKRQYPGGKRQFVGGELVPSPELRQYPGGKRQYPGGKRQYPGGKRQYPGGKRQYPGGKRQYPGGKRSESDQDLFPMEIRQYPGGKRQYPGGKRQYPGGKRQFPGGKRQFVGGEPAEQQSNIIKRFAPEDDAMDFLRLSKLYARNGDNVMNEEDMQLEDLLDDLMIDTRPEIEREAALDAARDILLGNVDAEDALALDLSALLEERNQAADW